MTDHDQQGNGTVLAMATMAVVIVASLALVAATQIVAGRAKAVTAADAAALAAAVNTYPSAGEGIAPIRAAANMARNNGARLIYCQCQVDNSLGARTVEVRVETPVSVILVGPVMVGAASRAEYLP